MSKNINEGFVSDFIKGFKDGYKSVINKSKSKGVIITDTVIKHKEGPVEYVLITVDNDGKKDDESDLLYTISAVDAQKYPIMAWSKDEWQTFEIVDPRTLKTLETVRTGKHTGPGFSFDAGLTDITKVLNKYNLKNDPVKEVVNNILAGVPVREALNEAYKTVNFVQTNKDLKIKSAGIKSDYATLLTSEQYNKYKSLLHKHPLDFTGWLKDGNSPDIGKFDIKFLAYPLAVQPVIHLSSVGELKQGDTFEYGGVDFVLLDNDFAISVSPIGKSEFRKEFDTDVDAKDYEKSYVKKFVDNWFNKIKI